MNNQVLLDKLAFAYGYFMGCKKKRNYYLAQKYRGQCEILLELLMSNNYKFSDDPHDLYNIILTDIRGF